MKRQLPCIARTGLIAAVLGSSAWATTSPAQAASFTCYVPRAALAEGATRLAITVGRNGRCRIRLDAISPRLGERQAAYIPLQVSIAPRARRRLAMAAPAPRIRRPAASRCFVFNGVSYCE